MAICPFCLIAQSNAPAHLVYEDPDVVGFLDRRPVFHGHVLLIPRRHFETLEELPAELISPLFAAAQRLCRALDLGLEAGGTFVAMNNRISQSVPHLHVHIVPRRKGDGLKGFFWPRHPYSSDNEMGDFARRIRAAISSA